MFRDKKAFNFPRPTKSGDFPLSAAPLLLAAALGSYYNMHYHNNGLFFLLLLKKYNNDRGAQHIILGSHRCASNARYSIVFDAIIMTRDIT